MRPSKKSQQSSGQSVFLLSPSDLQYKDHSSLRSAIIVICLSAAYYGWTVVDISAVSKGYLALSYGQQINEDVTYGLLQGCVPAGAIFGAILSSSIMKHLTRKQFILAVNVLALIIEGIIQIPNIWVLLVCRFFQGIFSGNYLAIVPIYINDLSPKQIVGSYGAYTNLFIVLAIVLCFACQIIFEQVISLSPEPFWRIIWGANSILIIVQSLLMLGSFVPESPNSLIMKGKMEDARSVIKMFHKQQYVEQVLALKMQEVDMQTKTSKQRVKVSPTAFLIAFELPFLQQFVGLGSISAQVGNIIGTYSESLRVYLPLIVNSVQLIVSFFAVFLLKSMGRRTVTLLGNGGLCIINLAIAILFIYIDDGDSIIIAVSVLFVLFMTIFGLTLGPITWLYVPEIIPASMVPFATADNWAAATIVYSTIPIIVGASDGNPSILFFIFASVSFVCFVINVLLMVETKGLNRQQIANKYLQKCGAK